MDAGDKTINLNKLTAVPKLRINKNDQIYHQQDGMNKCVNRLCILYIFK